MQTQQLSCRIRGHAAHRSAQLRLRTTMDNSSVGYLSGELWNSPAPGSHTPHRPAAARARPPHDAAVHLRTVQRKFLSSRVVHVDPSTVPLQVGLFRLVRSGVAVSGGDRVPLHARGLRRPPAQNRHPILFKIKALQLDVTTFFRAASQALAFTEHLALARTSHARCQA